MEPALKFLLFIVIIVILAISVYQFIAKPVMEAEQKVKDKKAAAEKTETKTKTETETSVAVDCEFSDWSQCVNGTQSRSIITPASNGGEACSGELTQYCVNKRSYRSFLNTEYVDNDLGVGTIGSLKSCKESCDKTVECTGFVIDKTLTKKCFMKKDISPTQKPSYIESYDYYYIGDGPAQGASKKPIDCKYSDWGNCVHNTQTRTINIPSENDGKKCTESLTQACNSVCGNPTGPNDQNYTFIKDKLNLNSYIQQCTGILSQNEYHAMVMQSDGNVVIYNLKSNPITPIWDSKTWNIGKPPYKLNFYNYLTLSYIDKNTNLEETKVISTNWSAGKYLVMQDDGNLVIYRGKPTVSDTEIPNFGGGPNYKIRNYSGGNPVWASNG